ncbi:BQ2448_3537 [Microbotryum intermedium]|uniref:BQ2448_3537 protein n=1 Tax=Microbotryum intermedium TaxID=269621 RepID=A0A238FC44_9BASI|nr:BQ2448_3537 [Microbotryum intermedium]
MSATLDKHAFEKSTDKEPSDSDVHVTTTAAPEIYDPSQESIWTRAGLGSTAGLKVHGAGAHIDPLKEGTNPMLQQKMKPRHLTMIAVGGSIGTGLFIGSGQALRNGGPAGILIAWSLIGIMMINVTQCLGELAILYPVSGGFYTLAVRFLDPGFGMALGYNYLFQWVVVLPLEITAAGDYTSYLGGELWRSPGAFANGFKGEFVVLKLKVLDTLGLTQLLDSITGVCAVFVTAAFSFAGTELVGLAATETPNPRKTMPGAVKGTFWYVASDRRLSTLPATPNIRLTLQAMHHRRITVIYLSSLLIIGLNIPYNDERLLGGSGAGTSPFVIMVDRAGIRGLNHLINATICISVLSIGLSCVYAGSRVLTALAETGYAPKVFTYVDRSGRPLWSVLFVLAFGPIAYVNVTSSGGVIFDWLLALSGLSTLFTWGSNCLCHIRFRCAWKVQGHSVEELPFKAAGGIYGSWFGLILVILVLIAQFYVAIWPIGGMETDPKTAAETFFKVYLALPVLLFFWVTGRKSWLTVEEMRIYREERRNAPFFTRVFRLLFSN